MDNHTNSYHPITKVITYIGAALCFIFACIQLVSSIVVLPDVLESVLELSKGVLILYLAWSLWFVAKYSASPLTQRPFKLKAKSATK